MSKIVCKALTIIYFPVSIILVQASFHKRKRGGGKIKYRSPFTSQEFIQDIILLNNLCQLEQVTQNLQFGTDTISRPNSFGQYAYLVLFCMIIYLRTYMGKKNN